MSNWVRPTLSTKFHIDAEWWEEQGRNFRIHLLSHLCADCQARYKNYHEAELVDWIQALIAGGIHPDRVFKETPFAGTLLKKETDYELFMNQFMNKRRTGKRNDLYRMLY